VCGWYDEGAYLFSAPTAGGKPVEMTTKGRGEIASCGDDRHVAWAGIGGVEVWDAIAGKRVAQVKVKWNLEVWERLMIAASARWIAVGCAGEIAIIAVE